MWTDMSVSPNGLAERSEASINEDLQRFDKISEDQEWKTFLKNWGIS